MSYSQSKIYFLVDIYRIIEIFSTSKDSGNPVYYSGQQQQPPYPTQPPPPQQQYYPNPPQVKLIFMFLNLEC